MVGKLSFCETKPQSLISSRRPGQFMKEDLMGTSKTSVRFVGNQRIQRSPAQTRDGFDLGLQAKVTRKNCGHALAIRPASYEHVPAGLTGRALGVGLTQRTLELFQRTL